MRSRLLMVGTIVVVAIAVLACSSPGASSSASSASSPSSSASASSAASPSASAAESPSASAAESPSASAGAATVEAKSVTAKAGPTTVLVAANGMTVYTFTKDVKDSGKSECAGTVADQTTCLGKWPPLIVPAGTTPSAGTGVTGTLSTITRADDGTLQVTYNGLPLYFFFKDAKAGDAAGEYTGWNLVTP